MERDTTKLLQLVSLRDDIPLFVDWHDSMFFIHLHLHHLVGWVDVRPLQPPLRLDLLLQCHSHHLCAYGELLLKPGYRLHIWITSGSSPPGSVLPQHPHQHPHWHRSQTGDRGTCLPRRPRWRKVVGAGGGRGDYFAHQRRDLRGLRGSSKRRKKVRWRVCACIRIRVHLRLCRSCP